MFEIVNNRDDPKETSCEFCDRKRHQENCVLSLKDEVTVSEALGKIKDKREFILNLKLLNNIEGLEKRFNAIRKIEETKEQPINKEITLYDCLKGFNSEEVLDEDNKWYCPNCKLNVKASKTMSLYRLPNILIIHLKRFRANNRKCRKIDTLVNYPLDNFDMSNCITKTSKVTGECLYKLFAVSNHYGGLSGGHYTAMCYNDILKEWLEFNDSTVNSIDEECVVTNAAYVLFYQRINPSSH